MREREYKYDAFISYRHLPFDMRVAKAVQRLLESYKPPKGTVCKNTDRIRRLFRDQSELPTSGDLTAEIQDALEDSDYLIVICSPTLKESKWCMQEIRYFKELHGGRVDHILPLLIEGEPSDTFPEELRFEEFSERNDAGVETPVRVEVEPLGADIRADSEGKSLYKLFTEFLRPAASILGTEYDKLYRRQLRRRWKREIALAMGAVVVLAVVVGIVRYYAAETRATQANAYLLLGAQEAENENAQEALAYYSASMKLGNQTAQSIAAVILQQTTWPYLAESTDGFLLNGQAITQSGDSLLTLSDSARKSAALTDDGAWSLVDGIVTHRTDGTTYALDLGDDSAVYKRTTADGNTWVLEGDERFYFYTPGTDTTVSLDISQEDALPVCRNRVALTRNGYFYLYSLEDGEAKQQEYISYEEVFAPTDNHEDSAQIGRLWTDENGELLVWANGNHIALLDLRNETTVMLALREWRYALNDVVIDRSQGVVALAYGNTQTTGNMTTGGYVAVYRLADCKLMLQTELDEVESMQGICFAHNATLLLTRSLDKIHIWNFETGKEATASLALERCDDAVFRDDDAAILVDVGGAVETYCFAVPNLTGDNSEGTETYLEYRNAVLDDMQAELDFLTALGEREPFASAGGVCNVLTLAENTKLVVMSTGFYMTDSDGNVLSELLLADTDFAELRITGDGVLTGDGKNVYAIAIDMETLEYCAIRLSLSSNGEKLGKVTALDCQGYTPQEIFCGTELAAVVTEDNRILFYRGDDTIPSDSVMPTQNGSIKEIAFNKNDTLMVINYVVSTYRSSDYSGYLTEYSVLVLWNVVQSTTMAKLGDGVHSISKVCFVRDELCYFLGTTPQELWLPSDTMNQASRNALTALCCYVINESLALNSRAPTLILENTSWQERMTAEGTLTTAAETIVTDAMDARYTELYTQNGGDRLLAFEALAEEMVSGAYEVSLADEDVFYDSYLRAACELGSEEQIEAALSAYVARIEKAIADGEDISDSAVYFYADTLIYTMQYTTALDEQIYNALFNYYAAYLAQLKQRESDQEEYDYTFYTIILELALVQGNTSLLEEMQQVGMLDSSYFPGTYISMALLMIGETEKAAEEFNRGCLLYADSSESVRNYAMEHVLGLCYALMQRGYFTQEDVDSCLGQAGIAAGLKVSDLTKVGKDNGFYCGDVIFVVNGHRVLSKKQLENLLTEGEVTCYAIRDGLGIVALTANTTDLGVSLSLVSDAV